MGILSEGTPDTRVAVLTRPPDLPDWVQGGGPGGDGNLETCSTLTVLEAMRLDEPTGWVNVDGEQRPALSWKSPV